MNKTANAKDLSENLIIEPANCSGDSFPGDTCPCAALQDALQLIIQLQAKNAAQEAVIQEFARVKAQNAEYRHMLFGRASEKMTVLGKHDAAPSAATDEPPEEIPNSSAEEPAGNPIDQEESSKNEAPPVKSRRGAKYGHQGHGRRIPQDIPAIKVFLPVPEDQARCQICGKAGKEVPFTEESVQIDVNVQPVKVVYVRQKVKFDCGCDGQARFVTAPEPPQAVNKSKLSHSFLAWIIYLKYLLAIPLTRICSIFSMGDFTLSPSSVTGALKNYMRLLVPLYEKLAQVMKQEPRKNIDETGWKSFFRREGKESFLDWMWVFGSSKVALYVLDTSRSSSVLVKWLGLDATGVITSDRAHGYKKFAKLAAGIILSFCWAHFRRDFLRACRGYPLLEPWMKLWLDRISSIYRLNKTRLAVLDKPEAFARAQVELEAAVSDMARNIETELADPGLLPGQKAVLESAVKHWAGLTVFVDNPAVPLDNNFAERLLRTVALGRKNYYGSFAAWSGQLAAICLSIMQTAKLHGLKPVAYLTYYLDECARAGGVPTNLDPYLPWNIPPEIRERYQMGGKEQDICA
jgi:transposase